jgi:pyridoxamine 5'-phosphate oxidase-like protein
MTSSLPQEVREAFERFITCEYTTVGARQQPITWPVTPYYEQGGPTIDICTGLGYPKKADDARRHPSVSLLFSDPTGSGIESGIQVLVHGTAEVDEEDLEANRERYWRESGEKLPATKDMHPPRILRSMFNWYYTRIYVHVRPERVFVWPDGDLEREPVLHDAHLEEVRSGHVEEPPEDHGAVPDERPAWDARMDELGREHHTAVVSWLAPDGFPLSARLPIRSDPASRSIALESEPAALPLQEGRACLTAHRHAPDFRWQQNFQVRGDLARTEGGWRLTPRRRVGGFELPEGGFARYHANLGKAIRFYRTARRRQRR